VLGETLNYTVQVYGRNGALIGVLPKGSVSNISYDRRLDTFSSAEIRLDLSSCNDCDVISRLVPWICELRVYRESEWVWSGILLDVDMGRDSASLIARDHSCIFDYRFIHQDHTSVVNDDSSVYLKELLDDALLVDNAFGLTTVVHPSGVSLDRSVKADDYILASYELGNIWRSEYDYVCLLNRMVCFPTELPSPSMPTLFGEFFEGDLRVRRSGLNMGTRVVVDADASLFASFGEGNGFGLVEQLVHETGLLDQGSADLAARTRFDLVQFPVSSLIVPEGSRLRPSCPVGLSDLIPGRKFSLSVAVGCLLVNVEMRLVTVEVDVSGVDESIKVSFSSLGTVSS
jgi:hypothetical protein